MKWDDEQIFARVLQVSYDAARQPLPTPRHKQSLKKFTQHQLLACLVLKGLFRLDYRGPARHLVDHPDLRGPIRLEVVSRGTTFQEAAGRLLAVVPCRRIFDAVLGRARRVGARKRRVPLAALQHGSVFFSSMSAFVTQMLADLSVFFLAQRRPLGRMTVSV